MHKSSGKVATLLLGAVTILGITGCADSGIDLGPFGDVSGRVTLEGTALSEGLITFHCPDSGQVAVASIQPNGTYEMYLGKRKGLPVGQYKVAVKPPLPKRPTQTPGTAPSRDVNRQSNIPDKYRFETSSGLTASVVEGDNQFEFDLN